MPAQLTKELASELQLSFNPLTRHNEVRRVLGDPDMVGERVMVKINWFGSFVREDNEGRITIGVNTAAPLLGRNVLVKTASYVEGLAVAGRA